MRFQPLIVWWLVIPVVLLGLGAIGWQVYKGRKKNKQLLLPWARRAGLLVLLGITALGPSIPGGTSYPGVANLDVLFAVDTTASMGAQDYAGTEIRLAGAKKDLLTLSSKLQGAHFGLVTFDSKANVVLPFTSDNATFTAAVQTMNREIFGTSKGSAIDKPIDVITEQLKNSKTAHPERSRLLFYLGDGEQTTDAPAKSFSEVAPYISGGGVLGYGTSEGAKMLKYTGLGVAKSDATNSNFVTTIDASTKKPVPAISKLDETALKKIASELKVGYQDRTKSGDFSNALQFSKADLLIDKSRQITHYLNLYWLFAIPFALLLFWEWKNLILLILELRKTQGKQHAKV